MDIPEHYVGREQSYLKHEVLREYVTAWGHKLGSVARRRRVRLCYIDAFAGPWSASSSDLEDTSISIGLKALEAAAETWAADGRDFKVEAFFIERDPAAFARLRGFLDSRTGRVRTRAKQGEFGELVSELSAWLGTDAAFVFVDPKGWKGAAMQFIAPLMKQQRRDVLVNVMFDHIRRFKDDPRQFLRDQMRDFFGLTEADLPAGLDEEELFAFYRTKLKEQCHLSFAADLAIPHPTVERTKFRLVVGGSSAAVIELFRSVESKVVGTLAATVRDDAASRKLRDTKGQLALLATAPSVDLTYKSLRERGLEEAPLDLLEMLEHRGNAAFGDVWPRLLEKHHITKVELGQRIWLLHKAGKILVPNKATKDRSIKDEHLLRKA